MIAIYAFGRGHVICGEPTYVKHAGLDFFRFDSAVTIRNWSTKTGLGELADGPATAILDPIPYGILVPATAHHGIWTLSKKGSEKWQTALPKARAALLD